MLLWPLHFRCRGCHRLEISLEPRFKAMREILLASDTNRALDLLCFAASRPATCAVHEANICTLCKMRFMWAAPERRVAEAFSTMYVRLYIYIYITVSIYIYYACPIEPVLYVLSKLPFRVRKKVRVEGWWCSLFERQLGQRGVAGRKQKRQREGPRKTGMLKDCNAKFRIASRHPIVAACSECNSPNYLLFVLQCLCQSKSWVE